MRKLEKVFNIIDSVNEKLGSVISYSLIVVMLIQVMEVILRSIFNNPTIWAWDVNVLIFATSGMLAGAYALLHDTHVRLDILYRNWSPRGKAIADLITFPVVLLTFAVLIWQGGDMAWTSFKTGERVYSYFAPILWPARFCLPIAAFLLALQAIVKHARLFIFVRRRDSES